MKKLLCDPRLWFWCGLLLAGYLYVAGVINGRENPFVSRRGDYAEFLKLAVLAPLLYVVSGRRTLEPRMWNLAGFALPFFLGLHFYYLQRIDAVNYSLTAHDLGRMGWTARIVFGGIAAFAIFVAADCLRLARREGILPVYLAAALLVPAIIVGVAWLTRDTRHLHIHHWALFAVFTAFLCFRRPLIVTLQGLCAGVMVEGIATWSMATLWELN